MDQSTLERTRAWVAQVNLFWTNIGKKQLTWGLTIVAKVYGIGFLVELAGLVRYYMQINGNFDLTVVFATTLREIGWPKVSFAKASFSQF